jgi:hypothetical protein
MDKARFPLLIPSRPGDLTERRLRDGGFRVRESESGTATGVDVSAPSGEVVRAR